MSSDATVAADRCGPGENASRSGCKKRRRPLSLVGVAEVDVIVPVHNASDTLREAVESALGQRAFAGCDDKESRCPIVVHVCCYDDGSTDDSWQILQELERTWKDRERGVRERQRDAATHWEDDDGNEELTDLESHLHIARSPDGVARGAGYARNRAVELRPRLPVEADDDAQRPHGASPPRIVHQLLCLLDSDDVMEPTRVAEQVRHLLGLPAEWRERCLLGCQFRRDPPDATEHYANWANSLDPDRLSLERFREVTVLQPTWMMFRSRFEELGGYVEAPHPLLDQDLTVQDVLDRETKRAPSHSLRLIHPAAESLQTLRLAEDLRFFHAHLASNGVLRRHDCTDGASGKPLVVYRHRGNSQSTSTPRQLLVQLRARAFEIAVLQGANDPVWSDQPFVVWGAGRDGKAFLKALSPSARARVACLVDVDQSKIDAGFYRNPSLQLQIPVVHFAHLIRDPEERLVATSNVGHSGVQFGRIDKHPGQGGNAADRLPSSKQRKFAPETRPDPDLLARLPDLPVVVCVAMYRTGGALESNVRLIGRTEGKDLWHFS